MKQWIPLLVWIILPCLAFSKKAIDLPEVFWGGGIHVQENCIYITDGSKIHIHSSGDFTHTGQFGREGEGPGEFRQNCELTVMPDKLVVNSFRKVSYFSLEGGFLQEFRTPDGVLFMVPVGEHFVATSAVVESNQAIPVQSVDIYNRDFRVLKNLYRGPHGKGWLFYRSDATKKQDRRMVDDCISYQVYGNRIYFADTQKGFYVGIFDSIGRKIHEIHRTYEPLKVSDAYRNEVMDREKQNPGWEKVSKKWNFIFPEFFPAYSDLIVADDKLYFVTYSVMDGRSEVWITDLNGEWIGKALLPLDHRQRKYQFTICNDRAYYLLESGEGGMFELYVTDL